MARQTTSTAKTPAKSGSKNKETETTTRKRTGVFEFYRQCRQEIAKVTWPTGKETYVTTIMVFIMVTLAAIFFFFVDQFLGYAVSLVLGLGS